MGCPVCGAESSGKTCTRCGFEVREYFGTSPDAVRAIEGQRIDTARAAWQAQSSHDATAEQTTFRDRFLDGRGQGPEMVKLPAGTGMIGESGVQVPVDAFAIGQYLVTFEEWDACLAAKGTTHRPADSQWGRGRQPVINVNWHDVCIYADWLSQMTGQTYRLPSDIEWEYACRAGTTTLYSFGDNESLLAQYAWYKGNSQGRAHPVGEKKPNPWGLYDMHGNVWEWVADTHENGGRVLRGGSWYFEPGGLRSSFRNWLVAVLRNNYLGFRLVRVL